MIVAIGDWFGMVTVPGMLASPRTCRTASAARAVSQAAPSSGVCICRTDDRLAPCVGSADVRYGGRCKQEMHRNAETCYRHKPAASHALQADLFLKIESDTQSYTLFEIHPRLLRGYHAASSAKCTRRPSAVAILTSASSENCDTRPRSRSLMRG